MTRKDFGSRERDSRAARPPTTRRTNLVGLAGLVVALVLLALSIDGGPRIGPDAGPVGLLYPVGHLVLALTPLAADARYRADAGSFGRGLAVAGALSLAIYGGAVLLLVAGSAALGGQLLPFGALAGTIYVVTRLILGVYGLVLWRRTDASRLAAGLFVAAVPSVFVLGLLATVGFPAGWIEGPFYLAFAALGCDLLTGGTDAPTAEAEVAG